MRNPSAHRRLPDRIIGFFQKTRRFSAICLLLTSQATAFAGPEGDEPFVFAALGDSMTAGANTTKIGIYHKHSFASSDSESVKGHVYRLKQMTGRKIVHFNHAVPGGSSFYLPAQVQLVKRQRPDYVTLMIGANDACRWPDDSVKAYANYRERVGKALEDLVAANPKVRILLLPVPDVSQLLDLSLNPACLKRRAAVKMCWDLINPDNGPDEIEEFRSRVRGLNDILTELAARHPNNVLLRSDLQGIRFEEFHISDVDCFHPSVAGQAYMAELTFDPDWTGL